MKGFLVFCFCGALLGVVVSHAEENTPFDQPWTLDHCFALALKNSETLEIGEEDIRKAESTLAQTLGRALPQLSMQYNAVWQDRGGSSIQGHTQENSFRLKLPLLTGYREIAAIKGGFSFVAQKEEDKKRLKLLLFNDVASAYFAAVLAEESLKTTQKILALSRQWLQELQARVQLGRSRQAELLDIAADRALLESQLADAEHAIKTSRSLLALLVGVPIHGSLKTILHTEYLMPLEKYLGLMETHPEIQAKKEAVAVAKQAVEAARAGHFPGLELTSNYYTQRTGIQNPGDWNVTLGVTLPLWSWGAVNQAVLEAEAVLRQAQQTEHLTRRQRARGVMDAHEEALYALTKVNLVGNVVQLVQKSYETRAADYRHGLVTNFEVLDTLKRLHTAEQTLIAARFQSVLDGLTLETAIGKIPGDKTP